MKTTVSSFDFCTAFANIRPDNFSHEGLNALFDYLEDYEEQCETEIELDVIAICCEYTEYKNMKELKENYDSIETMEDLENHTTVIAIGPERGFIIADF